MRFGNRIGLGVNVNEGDREKRCKREKVEGRRDRERESSFPY